MSSGDWKRFAVMIGMLLLFGSILAEATNYIIINRGTDINMSNFTVNISGTLPASNVTAGTFDGGDFVFPSNLTVNNNLFVNGDTLLAGSVTLGSYTYCTLKTNGTGGMICGTDLNNYPVSISVYGTTTKTIEIERDLIGNISTTFTDLTGTGNESGIARNYSLMGSGYGSLPDWNVIYIDGVIKPMTNETLVFQFNNDTNPSYLYRRIQGLTFLYQAVTIKPQQNITLEQFPTDQERAISIVIYRTPSQIIGEYTITTYINDTYAAFKTMGSFSYKNTTNVNSFSITPTLSADSYLIVKSETP
jgi:hypothetical protein